MVEWYWWINRQQFGPACYFIAPYFLDIWQPTVTATWFQRRLAARYFSRKNDVFQISTNQCCIKWSKNYWLVNKSCLLNNLYTNQMRYWTDKYRTFRKRENNFRVFCKWCGLFLCGLRGKSSCQFSNKSCKMLLWLPLGTIQTLISTFFLVLRDVIFRAWPACILISSLLEVFCFPYGGLGGFECLRWTYFLRIGPLV